MAIAANGVIGPAPLASVAHGVGERFAHLLSKASVPKTLEAPSLEGPRLDARQGEMVRSLHEAGEPGGDRFEPQQLIDAVTAAQGRMDSVLAAAHAGKHFSPAELLSLQANIFSASQAIDLAGKVVEKATGGIRQLMQIQV